MRTDEEEIMKQTAYSQFELLAPAYRNRKRPERNPTAGEAGRGSKPGRRAEREPALPSGYVHIRSAIQALMALTRSSGCIKLGDRSRAIPAA